MLSQDVLTERDWKYEKKIYLHKEYQQKTCVWLVLLSNLAWQTMLPFHDPIPCPPSKQQNSARHPHSPTNIFRATRAQRMAQESRNSSSAGGETQASPIWRIVIMTRDLLLHTSLVFTTRYVFHVYPGIRIIRRSLRKSSTIARAPTLRPKPLETGGTKA